MSLGSHSYIYIKSDALGGFLATGLDNILRGMVAESISNFNSGINEDFRSASNYKGAPFDLATWSLYKSSMQRSVKSNRLTFDKA